MDFLAFRSLSTCNIDALWIIEKAWLISEEILNKHPQRKQTSLAITKTIFQPELR